MFPASYPNVTAIVITNLVLAAGVAALLATVVGAAARDAWEHLRKDP